jgi:hypothetical protein
MVFKSSNYYLNQHNIGAQVFNAMEDSIGNIFMDLNKRCSGRN